MTSAFLGGQAGGETGRSWLWESHCQLLKGGAGRVVFYPGSGSGYL